MLFCVIPILERKSPISQEISEVRVQIAHLHAVELGQGHIPWLAVARTVLEVTRRRVRNARCCAECAEAKTQLVARGVVVDRVLGKEGVDLSGITVSLGGKSEGREIWVSYCDDSANVAKGHLPRTGDTLKEEKS